MRTRSVLSIALLLLPLAAEAQRFPAPRTGTAPAQPVPLGKQPEPIARQEAFQRLRVSMETYPMASYLRAPGFPGGNQPASWMTVGAGTRIEYAVTPRAAATLDITSSIDGSPMNVETLELGGRLRRALGESRLTPYLDARVGLILAQSSASTPGSAGYVRPTSVYSGGSSFGYGAVAGGGLEYALTSTWALTSGAYVMQSRLSASAYSGAAAEAPYGLTSARVTLGIKYNPVRSMVLKQQR